MPLHPTVSALELSSPLCTHSCTQQEGQWCLHVVTDSKDLEQGHRKKKFILRKGRLDAEVLKPRDPSSGYSRGSL